jgi:hypothetical protein
MYIETGHMGNVGIDFVPVNIKCGYNVHPRLCFPDETQHGFTQITNANQGNLLSFLPVNGVANYPDERFDIIAFPVVTGKADQHKITPDLFGSQVQQTCQFMGINMGFVQVLVFIEQAPVFTQSLDCTRW